MNEGLFQTVCMIEGNPKWDQAIYRQPLYRQHDDIRNDFSRDYNRILHCTAYRRLKHKTQVFFATTNDHICTRIEHVNHVASISDTIVKFLGLNADLTAAIAIGHDLGHPPFGHHGQDVLNTMVKEQRLDIDFWHENNGLWIVDKLETLPDPRGIETNLNLTYAVRDGIVCHCGEIDEESQYPRDKAIDLYSIERAGEVRPYTWEGCVVKLADKISFLGRDIEDAIRLHLLSQRQINELSRIVKAGTYDTGNLSNTYIIHELIIDLCKHSNPDAGLRFSPQAFGMIKNLREFNYNNIYYHPRLSYFKNYAELVLQSIFYYLLEKYDGKRTLFNFEEDKKIHPSIWNTFPDWLIKYSNIDEIKRRESKYSNDVVFDISHKDEYIHMILTYISGMTDTFAMSVFHELISFR